MFKNRFVLAEEGYGYQRPDGNWTGLAGMLQEGEVDISTTLLTVTSTREEVLDFLDSVVMSQTVLVFKRQLESSTGVVHFLSVRSILCLACLFGLGCLISVTAARVHRLPRGPSSLSTFGSMVNQGVPETHLEKTSMKMLFFTTFLFGICLTALFSARLSSHLTVEKSLPLARDHRDVVEKDLSFAIVGKCCSVPSNMHD